ncbi:MAG TPA: M90 family metallopeptidase [Phycisphaerales bacterium]|jgi:Mlc titration factor MtfA (ptsG expression regulator)|nr:M90 family metallopeptidase [Phycisphaerales bacterium]
MMLVPFLTARRRRKLLERPMDESAERALDEQVALYKKLPEAARKKLRDFARVLVAEKHWEPCGELKERGLTPAMKLTIAAQAGLLLLGLGLDPLRDELYPNVESVLVYPAGFTSSGPRPVAPIGPVTIMSENFACLGEAWHQGPVILSWADAKRGGIDGSDGHNVVIHEFAHKLDMLDGAVNGTPLLESREQLENWKNVMTGEYIALGRASALGVPTVLNPYGATNPGEFFAVASEAFFERPQELRSHHARLYDALRGYYKQDPAAWTQTA